MLFGHSLGGVVALAFAARHPELVPAVVAYEAPMAWQPWWPSAAPAPRRSTAPGDEADAAERFMRRMVGDERWEGLPAAHAGPASGRGARPRGRAALDPPAGPGPLRARPR